MATDLKIGSADGIPVNRQGATSDPWIWAAGDVAIQENPHLDAPARSGRWDTARRLGEAVGASVAGRPGQAEILPYV